MKKEFKVFRDLGLSGLVGFFLGFLIFFIKDHMNMLGGFDKLPFYINGLIFIFTFVLTVSLHEFGHALGFIRYGLKMRAVFFTIFALIKEDNKWSFKLTSMKNLGGIAIPDIIWIEDEEDFRTKQRALAKAIIMGPITSVMVWLILTLASLLIISLTSNIYVKSALLTFIIFLGIDTLFIIGASFLKQESVIGDFPAYTIVKNDRFFVGPNSIVMDTYHHSQKGPEFKIPILENLF